MLYLLVFRTVFPSHKGGSSTPRHLRKADARALAAFAPNKHILTRTQKGVLGWIFLVGLCSFFTFFFGCFCFCLNDFVIKQKKLQKNASSGMFLWRPSRTLKTHRSVDTLTSQAGVQLTNWCFLEALNVGDLKSQQQKHQLVRRVGSISKEEAVRPAEVYRQEMEGAYMWLWVKNIGYQRKTPVW